MNSWRERPIFQTFNGNTNNHHQFMAAQAARRVTGVIEGAVSQSNYCWFMCVFKNGEHLCGRPPIGFRTRDGVRATYHARFLLRTPGWQFVALGGVGRRHVNVEGDAKSLAQLKVLVLHGFSRAFGV
jgi:hypothetical protein